MRTLIKFFLTYGIYFLFVLLELGALLLIVNNNHFQRSAFLSSCNRISATAYKYNQVVVDYFSLSRVNDELAKENTLLRNQNMLLENQLYSLHFDSIKRQNIKLAPDKEFVAYTAKAINNSTNKLNNFITLNKGWDDSIKVEMSVTNTQGVVGIVKAVSRHFSVVMPIINGKAQISCKIKGISTNSQNSVGTVKDIGYLKWEGEDPLFANMLDVPRHVPIKQGDTIVTSGYSGYFPEGIMVGTIESLSNADNDNYYDIKVRLSVNFSTISYVNVFDYKHKIDQENLEKETRE